MSVAVIDPIVSLQRFGTCNDRRVFSMGYKVNKIRGQWLLVILLFVTAVEADYPCLCSYQIEAEVLAQPKSTAKVDGYMYEFDCRAYYAIPGLDKAYAAVGNENKYGYVKITSDTQIQVCQGAIPTSDLVTTTPIPATTTTTAASTTTEKTPASSTSPVVTTSFTTPMPTTTTASTSTTTATTTHLTDPSKHTNHHTPLPASTATRTTTIQRPTLIFTTTKISTTFTSTKTTPTITLATSTMRTITTLAADITTTPISTTTKTEYLSNQAYCTSLLRTSNTRYVTNNGIFCYEYVNRSVSWEAARNDCRNRSGNLLEIESGATNDFIYNFIGNIQYLHPIWIGLHDQINEEAWMWDTGIPLTKTKYTNWVPSRYVDQYHATEDCCVFLWNRLGQWDDVDCDGRSYNEFTSKAYICQFKIPATP
ncbi:protein let-653-like isoform X4 [Dreissena polymorpha]|uniref:protein let-653-like isoform X4 n=1 Tax=Dreissena polymorpha TaxID=45954 RepID=UPI002263ABDF|nr:protein let-653-like isoform X4 [Dreissena polymorpha]